MLTKFIKYYHTLKYLKAVQVYYRLLYIFKNKFAKKQSFTEGALRVPSVDALGLAEFIPTADSWPSYNEFEFLNIARTFESEIDWNYAEHGKLWTYNLNYFDFLNQKTQRPKDGLKIIKTYIDQLGVAKDGLEPFPISLRVINWVKFLIRHKINDAKVNHALAFQIKCLQGRVEKHLLGNHLLENGFGLFYGGIFLNDRDVQAQAIEILRTELKEQILEDGAHFELSPMYHNIMLVRLLDIINLMQSNNFSGREFLEFCKMKAGVMLSWLEQISLENGNYPMFNDSAFGIAPGRLALLTYAKRLGLQHELLHLSDSGYRRYSNREFEAFVDVGKIGPDYIPGHAHSDSLNFVLFKSQKPLIVDVGISTYEKNERRHWERSTAAHNTVQLGDYEQTNVWGGFRVAQRAKTKITAEFDNGIRAEHDGYKKYGVIHSREWRMKDGGLHIRDEIKGVKKAEVVARFYFSPECHPHLKDDQVIIDGSTLAFDNFANVELFDYRYPLGYNKFTKAQGVKVNFKDWLVTNID